MGYQQERLILVVHRNTVFVVLSQGPVKKVLEAQWPCIILKNTTATKQAMQM